PAPPGPPRAARHHGPGPAGRAGLRRVRLRAGAGVPSGAARPPPGRPAVAPALPAPRHPDHLPPGPPPGPRRAGGHRRGPAAPRPGPRRRAAPAHPGRPGRRPPRPGRAGRDGGAVPLDRPPPHGPAARGRAGRAGRQRPPLPLRAAPRGRRRGHRPAGVPADHPRRGATMTMGYRLFGRSGLRVSELALGPMTFGTAWGWGAGRDECRRMFDTYAEAGGNFVDTANNYTNGTSERIVGELVAADRDHFVLATKYSLSTRPDDPNAGGNHRKNLVRAVEASLERLGTDYLDLLWLHMWDGMTPVEEVVRSLDDLVRAGKVLYLGVSDTPAWAVARAVTLAELRGWTAFCGLQVPWSLGGRGGDR